MISQRDGIYSAHMSMDLVFVLKQVKSVVVWALCIFHLSVISPYKHGTNRQLKLSFPVSPSETPAVPHLVLMIVLVISSIIATGATTYWLINTCQKKIATRNEGTFYMRNSLPPWGAVWPDDGIKSCPIFPNIAQKVVKSFFTWKLYYLW